jgi:hypothetical protein
MLHHHPLYLMVSGAQQLLPVSLKAPAFLR